MIFTPNGIKGINPTKHPDKIITVEACNDADHFLTEYCQSTRQAQALHKVHHYRRKPTLAAWFCKLLPSLMSTYQES